MADAVSDEKVMTKTEREKLMRQRDRAVFLAEHLFQMIPQSVWRASGGDDSQGHYEGDYQAEQIREEIAALAAGRWTDSGLAIEDTTTAGLLQQALDLYAAEDDIPSDVAEMVERLRLRLLEILG